MPPEGRNGKVVETYLAFVSAVSEFIAKMGFGPMGLTVGGLLFAIIAGFFLWNGHLIIGGLLLLMGGILDSLDGAVARATGKATKFGALFDSTLDRYAEFAVFIGFYGYLGHSHAKFVQVFQLMAIIALVGSVMVSYVRARSEGLGITCSTGFWQRPERLVALATAAILTGILNPIFIAWSYDYLHDVFLKASLIVLAIGTNWTAIGRLISGRKNLSAHI